MGSRPRRAGGALARTARAPVLAALFWLPVLLLASGEASGLPFQMLEYPSAILVRPGGQEIKADYSVEADRIPTELLLLHYRYGLTPRLEVSGGATWAHFIQEHIERLAEVQATAKLRLAAAPFQYQLTGYARYREALGDPVIRSIKEGFENVQGMVSRHADGGKDASVGILGRRTGRQHAYTVGLEYMNASTRNYGDFKADQTDVYTLYFSPEEHFHHDLLMVALENRYSYWMNRGDFYDVVPQVRWEFVENWVVETGVSIPVIGGQLYRYTIGITYQR